MSSKARSRDVNELSEAVSQLEADLAGLQTHQSRLQAEGCYVEAERVRLTAEEIRTKLLKDRGELLASLQQKQVEELDRAQISDFESFNQTWDIRLKTKSDISAETLAKQRESNLKSLQNLENELKSMPWPLKPSSALIQLREREKQAAKQKNYREAQACKQHYEELEQQERLEAQRKQALHIATKLNNAKKKLNSEFTTLEQRLNREVSELLTIRGMETEELLKKYQNSRKELLMAQGIERNQREGRQTSIKSSDGGRKVARLFDQSRQNTSREEPKSPLDSDKFAAA